ncbi:MAG: hypothetical protein ACI9S8_003088 [Chlamydiales bacterium]|jgi:hypothetical protein
MKNIVAAMIFLFGITSCASIVSKSDYPVSISSNPNGAEISIKDQTGRGVFNGVTPATVTLKAGAGYFSGADYTVTFTQNGYATHTAQIQRGVDGWYIAGNLVLGGLVGWFIVDPITGAMWTLKDLHSDMTPVVGANEIEGIKIMTLSELPQNLHSKLVKVN